MILIIPVIKPTREYGKYTWKTSVDVTGDYDAMVVAAPYDVSRLYDLLSFGIPIVDTRNIIKTKSNLYSRA